MGFNTDILYPSSSDNIQEGIGLTHVQGKTDNIIGRFIKSPFLLHISLTRLAGLSLSPSLSSSGGFFCCVHRFPPCLPCLKEVGVARLEGKRATGTTKKREDGHTRESIKACVQRYASAVSFVLFDLRHRLVFLSAPVRSTTQAPRPRTQRASPFALCSLLIGPSKLGVETLAFPLHLPLQKHRPPRHFLQRLRPRVCN